jgi:hypothetical protein
MLDLAAPSSLRLSSSPHTHTLHPHSPSTVPSHPSLCNYPKQFLNMVTPTSSDDEGLRARQPGLAREPPLPPTPVLAPRLVPGRLQRWNEWRTAMDRVLGQAREEIGGDFSVDAVTASQLPLGRILDGSHLLWSVGSAMNEHAAIRVIDAMNFLSHPQAEYHTLCPGLPGSDGTDRGHRARVFAADGRPRILDDLKVLGTSRGSAADPCYVAHPIGLPSDRTDFEGDLQSWRHGEACSSSTQHCQKRRGGGCNLGMRGPLGV